LSAPVSAGEEAKDYLRSLVDKGDGTIEIEKVGDSFEAWAGATHLKLSENS
jgi:hypothetical protein